MKKILFTIALLGSFVMSAFAQNDEKILVEPGRTEFQPHWFMQLQAGAGETVGEASFKDLLSYSFGGSVGYKFNEYFGLRGHGQGFQAKGGWSGGIDRYKWAYAQGTVDAMFDLSNLVCGYSADRIFNVYGVAGLGLNLGWHNGEANDLYNKGRAMGNIWEGKKLRGVLLGGLGVDIKVADRVAINLEANASMLNDKFNSKDGGNPDWQFNALAGLTFTLGADHRDIAPIYAEPEPAPAPVVEEKLVEEPVVVEEEIIVVPEMTQNIFFEINKYEVREAEMEKVMTLVEFMKENEETKVSVTGYADEETGSSNYNMKLSEKRAAAIVKVLIENGIDEARITKNAMGDTVQPFSVQAENRVTICIAK